MKKISVGLACLAWLFSAHAAVIYSQPASAGSSGYLSSTVVNTGSDSAQLVWQGFSVPVTTTLREIQWRGVRSVTPVNFQIGISPLLTSAPNWITGNSASETPTGTPGVYDYKFTLPAGFVLTGGQSYAIQIAGLETSAPDWRWSAGTGGAGRHVVQTPAITGDFIFLPSPGDVAFTLLDQATVPVTIVVNAMPSAGGSVTGGGTYNPGTNVTVTATPAAGRTLLNWTVAGVAVSTSTNFTFAADGNTALIANFSGPNTGPYVITGVVNPDYPGAGTIGGAGTYASGDNVDLDCSPINGLMLVNWSENNIIVSTNALYSFIATKDRVIQANITDPTASYYMQSAFSPANSGTISINGGGSTGHFNGGSLINFVATPAAGYHLVSWTLGADTNSLGTNNTIAHIVAFDNVMFAKFAPDNPNLLLGVIPVASGTVTGAGAYAYGSAVTVNAAPAVGYVFVNWKNGTTVVSTNASYSLTLTDGTYLIATFVASNRTITATAAPVAGGSVTGAGVVGNGAIVTLTAIPFAGYAFTNWTLGGVAAGTNNPVTFDALANYNFVANFTVAPVITSPTLTFAAPTAGTLGFVWPTNAAGFVLQQNSDLTTPNWTAVTNAVSVVGSNNQVTLTATNGNRFYRLQHP